MPLPSLADLHTLLTQTEDKARRRLIAAFIRTRQGLPLSQLERALLARNLDEAFRLVGLEPVLNALAEVQALSDPVRQAGWYDGLRGLPPAILRQPLINLSLGAAAQQSPDVLAAIQRQNLRRIQAITTETETAIRETLARGLRSGAHPRVVAKQIRQSIGLTTKQAAGVAKFRERIAAQDRDPAQVERMVDRYARRQLANRAETIALTETFTALHQGKRAQWDRLIRDRVIQSTDWETEFVTAADDRVCPQCSPLDGQRDPIGQGVQPPVHARCRCQRRLTLSGFRKGEDPRPARRAILAAIA